MTKFLQTFHTILFSGVVLVSGLLLVAAVHANSGEQFLVYVVDALAVCAVAQLYMINRATKHDFVAVSLVMYGIPLLGMIHGVLAIMSSIIQKLPWVGAYEWAGVAAAMALLIFFFGGLIHHHLNGPATEEEKDAIFG